MCARGRERPDWCKHMCEGERDMTGVNICVKERQDCRKHMCEGERDMTGINVCVKET